MPYVLLGKSSDLAYQELQSLANRLKFDVVSRPESALAEISGDVDIDRLITVSGGIVKVFCPLPKGDAATIISDDLEKLPKAVFALSQLGRTYNLKDIANDIRHQLLERGSKPHFRLLDSVYTSAGILSKSNEYMIWKDIVLKTIAVQNLAEWTKRDYDRPAVDPHSGMMPPKVARMMVNIALPEPISSSTIVYDPFCGSGTILVEAMDIGCFSFGSDISHRAVTDASANCSWYYRQHPNLVPCRVFQADVAHVEASTFPSQVQAIVFEGYLGPPQYRDDQIPNLVKGMEKLYKGAFKRLTPILLPGGYLVCALPAYITPKGVKNLDPLLDWVSSLGYTQIGNFTYGRPQARVVRSIYVLKKNSR